MLEAAAQELHGALEAVWLYLQPQQQQQQLSGSITTASGGSSTGPLAKPPLGGSSSANDGSRLYETRRSFRRLDRALQSFETLLEQLYEQEKEIELEAFMPLVQADLVLLLSAVGQALDERQGRGGDWRNHDVKELYDGAALRACRILSYYPLTKADQVDSLLDRIASMLLLETTPNKDSTRNPVLSSLLSCVHMHLAGVPTGGTLFPFLSALESIQLLQLVLPRCCDAWTRQTWRNDDNVDEGSLRGRFALVSLGGSLLQHISSLFQSSTTIDDVRPWLHQQFAAHDRNNASQQPPPQQLVEAVDGFLEQCRLFGRELLEYTLDVLDGAYSTLTTTTATTTIERPFLRSVLRNALRYTSVALSTIEILESLHVATPYVTLRSLWTVFADMVATCCCGDDVHDPQGRENRVVAVELLQTCARSVLSHDDEQAEGTKTFSLRDDSAVETAMSVTVLSTLDTAGIQSPELEALLDSWMNATGAERNSYPKRRKRASSEEESTVDDFSHVLQASLMASLIIPSNDSTAKPSIAKVVQHLSSSATSSKKNNVWDSLLAPMVADSMGISSGAPDAPSIPFRGPQTAESWSDRVLLNYIGNCAPSSSEKKLAEQGTAKDVVSTAGNERTGEEKSK